MEDVHREILRRNYSTLVRDMSPELVVEELYKDSILTLEMKETILMQLTRFAKNRKLLDIIPKRGQRAFHSFCLALEKAGQLNLSIGLREEHIGTKDSTNNQDTAKNLRFRNKSGALPTSYSFKIQSPSNWNSTP